MFKINVEATDMRISYADFYIWAYIVNIRNDINKYI